MRVRFEIVTVVAAAGCWTEPASAPVERPRAHHAEHARGTDQGSIALARELAWELRVTPGELLPQAVQRGVLLLDVGRNDVRTVCGDEAIAATEPWTAMLAEPTRDAARCFVSANDLFACTQGGSPGEPLLALRFVHADRWQLVGVIVGVPQGNAWAAKVDQLDAKIDSISCP